MKDPSPQATGLEARFEAEMAAAIPGWQPESNLPKLEHRAADSRFVLKIDGEEAYVGYEREETVLRITSTFVPPALRGRKIAGGMVAVVLEHAEEHGLTVDPVCSYVARFLDNHPEYACLRAKDSGQATK